MKLFSHGVGTITSQQVGFPHKWEIVFSLLAKLYVVPPVGSACKRQDTWHPALLTAERVTRSLVVMLQSLCVGEMQGTVWADLLALFEQVLSHTAPPGSLWMCEDISAWNHKCQKQKGAILKNYRSSANKYLKTGRFLFLLIALIIYSTLNTTNTRFYSLKEISQCRLSGVWAAVCLAIRGWVCVQTSTSEDSPAAEQRTLLTSEELNSRMTTSLHGG